MDDTPERYTELALEVAEHTITNRRGAILWWKEETHHRAKYGLSEGQIKQIAAVLGRRFPK